MDKEILARLKGQLYLITGASGTGKDHLISAARQRWPGQLMVAHRYMTHDGHCDSENNIALSVTEFRIREQADLFLHSWTDGNSTCALGCEVSLWMEMGLNVMVNGSCVNLDEMRRLFGSKLSPVLVDVAPDILEDRLRERGWDSEVDIARHLVQAQEYREAFAEYGMVLDNSGSMDQTLLQFGKLLQRQNATASC